MLREVIALRCRLVSLLLCGVLTTLLIPASLEAAPLISPKGIVNAATFSPPLLPGGAIAQGSIFSIFGAEIGPTTAASAIAFPLQTSMSGVSIKVIQGQKSVDAIPLYVS